MLRHVASEDTRHNYFKDDVVELSELEAVRMTSKGVAEYVEDEEPQADVAEPTE